MAEQGAGGEDFGALGAVAEEEKEGEGEGDESEEDEEEEEGYRDLVASAEAAKRSPDPVQDVVTARAALDAAIALKGFVDVEKNLLSEHIMRLMMHLGGGDDMPIQGLGSLEELEIEGGEESQDFIAFGGRTSSSRMSLNIPSPSSDDRGGMGASRPPEMPGAHDVDEGLSMEERCYVAVAETESIQDQMNIYRQESERMLDELQAGYDEAKLRIGEIRRDFGAFRREIMDEAEERGAKFVSAGHILKFLQERIKATRVKIEKLRERNEILHGDIADTEDALETKKDLSEILHAVDFDQMAIQKKQLRDRLRDRENEVYRLKEEKLKTEKALEKAQAHLGVLSEKYKTIKTTILERTPQLQRVKADIAKSVEMRARARDLFAPAVKELDESTGEDRPSVMEYLRLKTKLADLEHVAHITQMKVEVADLTATQLAVKLREVIKFRKKMGVSQATKIGNLRDYLNSPMAKDGKLHLEPNEELNVECQVVGAEHPSW